MVLGEASPSVRGYSCTSIYTRIPWSMVTLVGIYQVYLYTVYIIVELSIPYISLYTSIRVLVCIYTRTTITLHTCTVMDGIATVQVQLYGCYSRLIIYFKVLWYIIIISLRRG